MRIFYTIILLLVCVLGIIGAARYTPSAVPSYVLENGGVTQGGPLLDCDVPHAFSMSAMRLRHTAWCTYGPDGSATAAPVRIDMVEDIYIKAMSYAYLNKVFFFLSVVFAIFVLIWPSLVAFWKNDPTEAVVKQTLAEIQKTDDEAEEATIQANTFLTAAEKSDQIVRVKALKAADKAEKVSTVSKMMSRIVAIASMQTTVTALAALSFAFYAHYKDNQTTSEGLMRTVIYAKDFDQPLMDKIITQMQTMDRGFGFAKALPSIAEANENPGG